MSGVVVVETVRRHLTRLAFVVILLMIVVIALAGSQIDDSTAWMWPSLISLLMLVVGAQLIGPEFSSGTLQLILSKPIGRSSYLLSRVAGVALVVWLVVWLCYATEMIGRLADGTAGEHVERLTAASVNLSLEAILVLSLLALFGTFTRAYFNIALYLVLQITIGMLIGALNAMQRLADPTSFFGAVGRFLSEHPGIVKSVVTVDRNLFPDPPRALDAGWTMLVLSNAAVALLLACLVFRRREVPYGAD